MNSLQPLLKFVALLNTFRRIKRVVRVNGEDRWENDVEHSYFLAMLAWHIILSERLALNADLAMKYALIHDLVEVHAGDTYFFSNDQQLLGSKKRREHEAAGRLNAEYPEMNEIHDLIDRFERRADEESKFIFALDKIQPMINIYADDGRTWKEKGITLDMIIERKKDKVAVSPKIKEIFDELVTLIRKREKQLF